MAPAVSPTTNSTGTGRSQHTGRFALRIHTLHQLAHGDEGAVAESAPCSCKRLSRSCPVPQCACRRSGSGAEAAAAARHTSSPFSEARAAWRRSAGRASPSAAALAAVDGEQGGAGGDEASALTSRVHHAVQLRRAPSRTRCGQRRAAAGGVGADPPPAAARQRRPGGDCRRPGARAHAAPQSPVALPVACAWRWRGFSRVARSGLIPPRWLNRQVAPLGFGAARTAQRTGRPPVDGEAVPA